MPASPDAAAMPRSSGSLLVDRTFGPWFWGLLASNGGNWLFNVTAAIIVFRLSGSAFMVGMVSVAQFIPQVLLSPIAGSWSDRVDRRRLLIAGQSVSAAFATTLAVAVQRLGLDGLPGVWPVILTALGVGLGLAISGPSLNALVPALVEDRDLEKGIALTSLTFNVGRALGPAGAGVLLTTLGAGAAFTINAISFLPLLAALLIVRPRPREEHGGDRSVRAGLRYVRHHREILLPLVGVGAAGFAMDPAITLSPPLAAELGGGDALVAAIVSAFGITGAVGALLSGKLQLARGSLSVARFGLQLLITGLLLAAVAPLAWVALAGFAATGVGFVFAMTSFTSILQRRVPDELRGRVMALWGVAFLGTRPLAAALSGAVADLTGPRWAMGIAIVVALGALAVVARLARVGTPAEGTA